MHAQLSAPLVSAAVDEAGCTISHNVLWQAVASSKQSTAAAQTAAATLQLCLIWCCMQSAHQIPLLHRHGVFTLDAAGHAVAATQVNFKQSRVPHCALSVHCLRQAAAA
jgi:hypothetical protein